MFQMRFYALVLWRSMVGCRALLQLLYLGSGEVLRYQPDEADLRATERKLAALWAAISRAAGRATGGPARAGCASGATTRRLPGVRRHPPAAARAGRRHRRPVPTRPPPRGPLRLDV